VQKGFANNLHTEQTKDRPLPIPDPPLAVTPIVTAGLLLSARTLAAPHGLELPSVAQILEATGATRSRAYELKDTIIALLPALARPPGRPRVAHDPPPPAQLAELTTAALRFVMAHPGCVQSGERASYSAHYRRFVIELREHHADVMRSAFAEAIQIPLGTLDDWMRVTPRHERGVNDTTNPLDERGVNDTSDPVDERGVNDATNPLDVG
jgi:hypothetical protein